MATDTEDKAARDSAAPSARLRWDASGLHSARCTVASASAGRAGVVLNFGIDRSKGRSSAEIGIELQYRVVLDPVAAKRLQELLSRVIGEYEARPREPK